MKNLSFFSDNIGKLLPFMRMGMRKLVGDGRDILFWHDI
jgi:hypothetical protein